MDDAVLERADLYTHHLYLSDFGREWAARVRTDAEQETGLLEVEYLKGYAQALEDVVSHLESGECLPGGPLYTRIAAEAAISKGSRA